MLKKRIIFVLLYGDENFYLSRNFRLQKIGNLSWLKNNYNFSKISFHIDELAVINISKKGEYINNFCEALKKITKECFLPIAAGGGIRNFEHAQKLMKSGADKIIFNTTLFEDFCLVKKVSEVFGQQCIVGQIDVKKNKKNTYNIFINSGTTEIIGDISRLIEIDSKRVVGEWILNSIDRDGTGQGYDLDLLSNFPHTLSTPLIIMGGAGNSSHLIQGLKDSRIDAVATAHLHNFVGNGLSRARQLIRDSQINLALWPELDL